MNEDSGEFSDELDEFEESADDRNKHNKNGKNNQTSYSNKPYDEAYEISQDLSMAESFDGRDKNNGRERQLKNDKYDEAVEVSQSLDQSQLHAAPPKTKVNTSVASEKGTFKGSNNDEKGMSKTNELSKSQSILNRPFDEALEFSKSSSEESVDTRNSSSPRHPQKQHQPQQQQLQQPKQQVNAQIPQMTAAQRNAAANLNIQNDSPPTNKKNAAPMSTSQTTSKAGNDESSEEDGDQEESYDNIEGAYNPKEYLQLNVSTEVRDLFQYIERYKPHEVQLDAPLKCFIPEYIPAIGELDAFIKVPRPDNKDDGLGLKYLDEPSTNQSDPTVLELQLRAKSKKLQYGDVAVRSIENADKNPQKVEKWIQDIKELHRSKPPPQVTYKKNMPDIDSLMEVWPEEFEVLLGTIPLPSPDLDLSLAEYAKTLCTLLDIPTYDNPIESLHLMFSLFIDFRNNPHFQARLLGNNNDGGNHSYAEGKTGGGHHASYDNNYGNADVLEIEQNEYK